MFTSVFDLFFPPFAQFISSELCSSAYHTHRLFAMIIFFETEIEKVTFLLPRRHVFQIEPGSSVPIVHTFHVH